MRLNLHDLECIQKSLIGDKNITESVMYSLANNFNLVFSSIIDGEKQISHQLLRAVSLGDFKKVISIIDHHTQKSGDTGGCLIIKGTSLVLCNESLTEAYDCINNAILMDDSVSEYYYIRSIMSSIIPSLIFHNRIHDKDIEDAFEGKQNFDIPKDELTTIARILGFDPAYKLNSEEAFEANSIITFRAARYSKLPEKEAKRLLKYSIVEDDLNTAISSNSKYEDVYYNLMMHIYLNDHQLKDVIKYQKKAIQLSNPRSDYYFDLVSLYKENEDNKSAIEYCVKGLSFDKGSKGLNAICGVLHYEVGQYNSACKYFTSAVELSSHDNHDSIYSYEDILDYLALCYLNIDKPAKALKLYQNHPFGDPYGVSGLIIGLLSKNLITIQESSSTFLSNLKTQADARNLLTHDNYKFYKDYFKFISNFEKPLDLLLFVACHINPTSPTFSSLSEELSAKSKELDFKRDDLIVMKYVDQFIDRDENFLFSIREAKILEFKLLIIDASIHGIQNNELYLQGYESDVNKKSVFVTYLIGLKDFIHNNELLKTEIEKGLAVTKAKLSERDKVIADLSHSIKNLISTVSDPLENLKDTGSFNPQIVENALVGTNLIRGIVNAMNLSYAGSIDDFYYDSKHSADNDAVSIDSIIIDAIVNSVSNIFSPKYFDVYKRNFFPTKKEYEVARSEWSKIIPITDRNSLLEYLNEYFFAFDISFYGTSKLAIGDTRGSSTKLMILFQELILNAVKYSSFVPRNRREVKIRASRRKGNLQFQVSNSHKPNQQSKTSGIGHLIIENFVKLIRAEKIETKDDRYFKIVLEMKDFWEIRK